MTSQRLHVPCLQNEILYNIAACVTLPASAILRRCTVSSSSSAAITSRKSQHNPSESAEFFCRLAFNPQKGLYYEHNWDACREEALRILTTIDETQTATSWPNDDIWAVKLKSEPKRPRKADGDRERPSPRKRRRVGRKADSDSESEDGDDSADEFKASASEGTSLCFATCFRCHSCNIFTLIYLCRGVQFYTPSQKDTNT